ncbi:glycosyltransferase [Acidovorax sp. SUPP950]|uniref:glycosyltransferase n=1 Tax=Acidovorax sp. SUPP950 TaxID=511901 RepID=UPI0023C8A9E7|nr:glycosyltransferase family A protein [Acidovorax sp. SUPP950]GKS75961.1 glycosyltransferase [Acidovorax sp. SUPP950]
MIGVCIPAHDEAALIGACLDSVCAAAAQVQEPVRIVVVADACRDATAALARTWGCDVVEIGARCVGAARAVGMDHLVGLGARWLCCTDADSRVPPQWITAQLACASDAVCGTIGVEDWHEQPLHVAQAFASHYQDRNGHRHIHGANLGVSSAAYRRAGGFAPLVAHEDVRLVEALLAQQATVAWVRDPRVITSARCIARAPEGFAAWLQARWHTGGGVPAGAALT